MVHAVLLGHSVFDNCSYVAPEPDVILQVREKLVTGSKHRCSQSTGTSLAMSGCINSRRSPRQRRT